MTGTRARWIEGIPDLHDEGKLGEAGTYLTVNQVSEHTGFSPKTITDLLSREVITSDQPLGALSRPAVRIGTTPLYSQDQVTECLRRHSASGRSSVASTVPKITAEQAQRSGLVTVQEIATEYGFHEQSVRKWASRTRDFPKVVATRERDADRHSGVPFNLYRRDKVRTWLIANGKIADDGSGADIPEQQNQGSTADNSGSRASAAV